VNQAAQQQMTSEKVIWQTDSLMLDMYKMLMQTPEQSENSHLLTMLQLITQFLVTADKNIIFSYFS